MPKIRPSVPGHYVGRWWICFVVADGVELFTFLIKWDQLVCCCSAAALTHSTPRWLGMVSQLTTSHTPSAVSDSGILVYYPACSPWTVNCGSQSNHSSIDASIRTIQYSIQVTTYLSSVSRVSQNQHIDYYSRANQSGDRNWSKLLLV